MKLQIVDIYKLLTDIIKNYPEQEKTCKRPHTWAVIEDEVELYDLSLEKSKYYQQEVNQPFFWSRAWDALDNDVNKIPADSPYVLCFQNRFEGELDKLVYYLSLYVTDDKRSDITTSCGQRTFGAIELDCQEILITIIKELFNQVYVSIDGEEPIWKSLNQVKADKENGIITQYKVYRGFDVAHVVNRKDLQFNRIPRSKNRTGCGVTLQIKGLSCE